jgi:hypothetical protein
VTSVRDVGIVHIQHVKQDRKVVIHPERMVGSSIYIYIYIYIYKAARAVVSNGDMTRNFFRRFMVNFLHASL